MKSEFKKYLSKKFIKKIRQKKSSKKFLKSEFKGHTVSKFNLSMETSCIKFWFAINVSCVMLGEFHFKCKFCHICVCLYVSAMDGISFRFSGVFLYTLILFITLILICSYPSSFQKPRANAE